MNRICCVVPVCFTLFVFSAQSVAAQQTTAASTVVFEIREINEISISGDPDPLVVSHATPGGAISVTTDEGTTWSFTTNGFNKKITAFLDAPMPSGVSLAVALSAPAGATAAGSVPLSAAPQTIIGNIGTTQASALRVTYTLSATPQAGVLGPDTRIITYTIVAES